MKFDKEFKDAISNLPEKEKDKLILRLLKHDLMLANQLHFELVSMQSKEDLRHKMEIIIRERVDEMTRNFYSAGYLLMDMRFLSGEITEHVKVTKDKIGDISLNLSMITQVLHQNTAHIQNLPFGKTTTFCTYIIAKAFKLMVMLKALDEDYLADFKPQLHALGILIGQSDHLMRTAIHHGLDVNWLISGEIPADIKQQHLELKQMGFLK